MVDTVITARLLPVPRPATCGLRLNQCVAAATVAGVVMSVVGLAVQVGPAGADKRYGGARQQVALHRSSATAGAPMKADHVPAATGPLTPVRRRPDCDRACAKAPAR